MKIVPFPARSRWTFQYIHFVGAMTAWPRPLGPADFVRVFAREKFLTQKDLQFLFDRRRVAQKIPPPDIRASSSA